MPPWFVTRCLRFLLIAAPLAVGGHALAYEANYPATAPGTIEIKTLPAARVLEAVGSEPTVEKQNRAFMTLFRYIDSHELRMTVPVETAPQPARMRFFVERGHAGDLPDAAGVTVYERPATTVVSLGIRGGYTQEHFDEAAARLKAWLEQHPDWRPTGPPYAVYWNGPFVPGFLKRSEVHVPVEPSDPAR